MLFFPFFFFAFRTENLFKQVAALCRCRRVATALLTSQLASLPLHFGAARERFFFLPNYMAAICSTQTLSATPLTPPLSHFLLTTCCAPWAATATATSTTAANVCLGFYSTLCSCCLCFVVALLLLLLLVVHIFCFSANCLLYFAITELVLSYLISQLIETTNKELNYLLYEYICLLISQD